MASEYRLNPEAYKRRYLPWLWVSMAPSFLVDTIILFQTIKAISLALMNSSTAVGELLVDGLYMLFINALLIKSVPLIVYFLSKSHLQQSHISIKPGEVVFFKRKWVGYEFDYGYTFFHEYHLSRVEKITKKRDGSLRVFGKNQVYCFYHDKTPVMDLRKNELIPKVIHRRKCCIPAVFDGLDEIQRKLDELHTSM